MVFSDGLGRSHGGDGFARAAPGALYNAAGQTVKDHVVLSQNRMVFARVGANGTSLHDDFTGEVFRTIGSLMFMIHVEEQFHNNNDKVHEHVTVALTTATLDKGMHAQYKVSSD